MAPTDWPVSRTSPVYFGSDKKDNATVIAYQYSDYIAEPTGAKLLNIWSQATGNID